MININGHTFEISEAHKGWVWEHLDSKYRAIKDGGFFATQSEAYTAARVYVEELEQEQDDLADQLADECYGTYEDQVISFYNDITTGGL